MYAVIETGGKQYRVEVGTVLEVEKLSVEAGQMVTLDRVLLVADGDEAAIGRPVVDGAAVSAEVVRQDRADKVIVFKYRPKARRRVKKGHRQDRTVLRVSDITFGGRSAAADAAKAVEAAKTERQRLEEAAARQAAADAELAARLSQKARATEATEEAPARGRRRGKSTAAEPTAAKKPTAAEPGAEEAAAAEPTAAKKPTAEEAAEAAPKPTAGGETPAKPASRGRAGRAATPAAEPGAASSEPTPKRRATSRTTKKDG